MEQVIKLRSYIEAALDFAEEEIDFLAEGDIQQHLQQILDDNQQVLQRAEQGQVLNEGMNLAIAGQPNAGKSSLLNYLAGYDAAIVTDIAGTTRDVIREHIALKGVPVKIIDTAGLRESDDPVEQEGIRRAWHEIERADLVVLLVDARQGMTGEDHAIEQKLDGLRCRKLFTKADLLDENQRTAIEDDLISTKTGEGIDAFIEQITSQYSDYNQDHSTFIARKRHVEALQQALQHAQNAQNIFLSTGSGELMAEDLRQAQHVLNEITGEFTSEDLLGRIFSSFCIGK